MKEIQSIRAKYPIVDVPPLMEYMKNQLVDSFLLKIESIVRERCNQLGYKYDSQRLFVVSVNDVGDLWYYRMEDGCLSPLIAFSFSVESIDDDGIGGVKVTRSCRELHSDVFKPKKHEENSNPFRKGLRNDYYGV